MAEIEIRLNGEFKKVPEGSTVSDLVKSMDLVADRIAIEYNMQILKRDRWSRQLLSAGDKLELVHFVGGG